MTLKKLLELLQTLQHEDGIKLRGSYIFTSNGGELAISFNTQPSKALDRFMNHKGFIVWEGIYIYRPRQ